MAKRKLPGGGGGNMQQLMRQAQKMQQDMARIQEELAEREVEAASGGGMVKAVVTGKKELKSITIAPEAADPDDIEMLQDLILAAVNEALRGVDQMTEGEMGKLTGGLGLPGMF
ncbi:MAG: YbaB/EbfC family nucleoid-associated protein [Clostridiales bacterium]|nr:YbaB/EbfC family nucleoid-associated protein [Clostridiales bacterium]